METKTRTITEGNRLIAEFEGYETYEGYGTIMVDYGIDEHGNENERTIEDTHYHSSWDWLMPVVEKIETLFNHGIDVNILSDGTTIEQLRDDENGELHHPVEIVRMTAGEIDYKNKIQHTWLAVVEFIEWYNNKK